MVQILVLDSGSACDCKIESFVLDDTRLPLLDNLLTHLREQQTNIFLPQPDQASDTHAARPELDNAPPAMLSHRELQTVWLLGQGKSISDIAKHLSLSVKTISTYRARALEKLELRTTAQLIRYAIQLQLEGARNTTEAKLR